MQGGGGYASDMSVEAVTSDEEAQGRPAKRRKPPPAGWKKPGRKIPWILGNFGILQKCKNILRNPIGIILWDFLVYFGIFLKMPKYTKKSRRIIPIGFLR